MAIAMEFIRNFLKKWETRQLIGYIPCEKRNYRGGPGEGFEPIGQSGVTIATGLDLGQQTRGALIRYGITGTLLEKLSPYLEKTRYRAIDALRERTLAVTDEECTLIDDLVHADYVRQAQTAFDRMSPFNFTDTPKEVQTALVSMYYQLGSRACRHAAWRFLAAGKFGKAAETLCSDRTRYKARRRDEGKLLKRTGGEQDA